MANTRLLPPTVVPRRSTRKTRSHKYGSTIIEGGGSSSSQGGGGGGLSSHSVERMITHRPEGFQNLAENRRLNEERYEGYRKKQRRARKSHIQTWGGTKFNKAVVAGIWPVERQLINHIMHDRKGFAIPYKNPTKIPKSAQKSLVGALHLLDLAELKNPKVGFKRHYTKYYNITDRLPRASVKVLRDKILHN